jgi:hypothetical protein
VKKEAYADIDRREALARASLDRAEQALYARGAQRGIRLPGAAPGQGARGGAAGAFMQRLNFGPMGALGGSQDQGTPVPVATTAAATPATELTSAVNFGMGLPPSLTMHPDMADYYGGTYQNEVIMPGQAGYGTLPAVNPNARIPGRYLRTAPTSAYDFGGTRTERSMYPGG